jgi:hypothetical protein
MPMPYELKQEDRSDKTRLRLWTFRFWRQETVLDLFAGEGGLSQTYVDAGCERLICVEKDKEIFQKLEAGALMQHSNIEFRCLDNMDFLENVGRISDVSFVDFDAYGCPNLQIQRFFENYPVNRAIMVNVTDGTLYNLSRTVNINLKKYFLVNLYPSGRLSKKDYDSKRKLRRVLPWLQEHFIHLLAAKNGFNTFFLYHAMNNAANVTYYGFMAFPEIHVDLMAFGKTPITRFKKDRGSMIKTIKRLVKT